MIGEKDKEVSAEDLAQMVVNMIHEQMNTGHTYGISGLFDPIEELSLRIVRKELGERSRDAELGGHVRAIVKDLLTR